MSKITPAFNSCLSKVSKKELVCSVLARFQPEQEALELEQHILPLALGEDYRPPFAKQTAIRMLELFCFNQAQSEEELLYWSIKSPIYWGYEGGAPQAYNLSILACYSYRIETGAPAFEEKSILISANQFRGKKLSFCSKPSHMRLFYIEGVGDRGVGGQFKLNYTPEGVFNDASQLKLTDN